LSTVLAETIDNPKQSHCPDVYWEAMYHTSRHWILLPTKSMFHWYSKQ